MLRYAISDGQFALGHQSAPRTAAFLPDENALPSEQSEEPPHIAPSRNQLRHPLLVQAESLAAQQVDFFLLREPDLPASQLATLAREILIVLSKGPTRLLLHNRPDIAAATRSHGIHLPATHGALTPHQVRTVYTSASLPAPIVSLSCHTSEDLLRARDTKPDLILFGPVFGKAIANQLVTPPAGLDALRAACRLATPIPVLALGGIIRVNIPACLEAGAAGIAAIRLFNPEIEKST